MKQLVVSKTLPGIRVTVLSYDDVYPPYQRGHRRHYKKGYWQLRIDVLEGHHALRPGRTCYDLVRVHTSWRRKLADGLAVRQIALPDFAVLRVLKYQKHKSLNERPFLTIRLQNLQTGVAKHWKLSFPLTLVRQSQPRVEFTLDTPNNLNFIAIDNGTEVTGITTKVTTFSDSGIDYLVPALIVSVSNPNGVFGEIKMSLGDLFPFVSSTRQ